MIVLSFHRRRAERFAHLIDEAERTRSADPVRAAGTRRHRVRSKVDDNLTDLASMSHRLRDLPVKVDAQPEFRDGLRAMLMATIERDGIGATAAPEPAPSRRGSRSVRRPAGSRPVTARRTRARGAIVVGLAAGTLALSGMSAASGDAIPGDPLYSVKRSTERAQLALAGSDISRGQLYLEFARTRLDEAQAVQEDPTGISAVLDDMDVETLQGTRLLTTAAIEHKDATALDAIDGFANAQRTAAQKVRDGLSGEAHTRVGNSITVLDEILRRAKALRPILKCGTAAVAGADQFGPVPKLTSCRSTGQRPALPAGARPDEMSQTGDTGAELPGAPAGAGESAPAGTADPLQPASPVPFPSSSVSGGLVDGVKDLIGGIGY